MSNSVQLSSENLTPASAWNIGWGFGYACNMNCRFCYSIESRAKITKIADIENHLRFVKENAQKISTINWGTSENAIMDEWFTLIGAIKNIAPHIVQGVTTNGFCGYRCSKDPKLGDTFINCIEDVDVSLDFYQREKHNAFRGNSSAFDWALNTLDFCQKTNIPSSIVMLGCNETFTEDNLQGIFALAQEFDCNIRINILRPVNGYALKPLAYKTALLAALMGLQASDPSGTNSLRILPDGSVTPSTYLIDTQWLATNICSSDIRIETIASTNQFRELASAQIPELCTSCNYLEFCRGGCKDRRIIWYKTLSERDPYCPSRNDGDFLWANTSSIRFAEKTGPLIHDGYLPTLIFRGH